jgi:hypothetical protein
MLQVRLSRIPGITARDVLRESLIFGVILGDFEWSEDAEWREFQTVAAGTRSQPGPGSGAKGRGLRALSMEVLTQWGRRLPYENDRGSTGNEIRDGLAAILRARAPFRFVATLNTAFDTDPAELRMDARLLSMTRTTRHGQPDSRYLSIDISEYRGVDTDRRSRIKSDKFPLKHKLAAGDTLRSLAKRYYKNQGSQWNRIKEGNGGSRGRMKGLGPDDAIVGHGGLKAGATVRVIKPTDR